VPGLQRYLIIFDPLAFVLDQQGLPGWLLSPLVVFPRSQNFTSRVEVRPAPSAPIDRDLALALVLHRPEGLKGRGLSNSVIPCFSVQAGRPGINPPLKEGPPRNTMRPRGPPAYSERADLLTMTMSLAREGRQSRPTELRTGREAALPLPDHLGA